MNLSAGIDRPLSIAEIVDRSVTLAVRRWRILLVLVLVQAVPVGIARAWVEVRSPRQLAGWWVLEFLLLPLISGAVALVIGAIDEPSAARALRASARRYGALLLTASLAGTFLWMLSVAVVGVSLLTLHFAAGIVTPAPFAGFAIAVPAMLVLFPAPYLISLVATPIVVLENASPWKALVIAFRRARRAGWRRAWLLGATLLCLDLGPVAILVTVVHRIVTLTQLPALAFFEELTFDAVTLGFAMVVATVMSIEMRVRYEGADLEAVIDHAEASASAAHANGGASSAPMSSAGSE